MINPAFSSQLMLYASTSAADAFCHLNAWDKYSVPMHTLHVGLKNRQLDTVAFFLKSRENGIIHPPVCYYQSKFYLIFNFCSI